MLLACLGGWVECLGSGWVGRVHSLYLVSYMVLLSNEKEIFVRRCHDGA
jgi:hypothetical protein